MARRTSLREFQQRVNERLAQAATRKAVASKLGFQTSGRNWFVALDQVSEVIPVPALVSVPLTKAWYWGVANVRGNLFSVIDFSSFQGGEPIGATGGGLERRVILISERLLAGSGLVVSRMLGLRNPDQFELQSGTPGGMPWIRAIYRDGAGAVWHDLDLEALATAPAFLSAGVDQAGAV
jgi:twitching motility protein PilI